MKKTKLIPSVIITICVINLFFCANLYSYTQDTRDKLIEIHYKRGIWFYKQCHYDKAYEEFEKVIEIDPENKSAKKYLAITSKKKNKTVIYSLYDQAKEFMQERQYQEALDTYKSALEIMPNDGYSKFQTEYLEDKIRKIDGHNAKINAVKEKKNKKIQERAAKKERKELKAQQKAREKELRLQEKALRKKKVQEAKVKPPADNATKSEIMSKDLEQIGTTLNKRQDSVPQKQETEYNFTIQFKKEQNDKPQDKLSNEVEALKKLESEMIKQVGQ